MADLLADLVHLDYGFHNSYGVEMVWCKFEALKAWVTKGAWLVLSTECLGYRVKLARFRHGTDGLHR